LPDLKLWDHAAVVVHRKSSDSNLVEDDDTHILVFGGYGIGPSLKTASNNTAEEKEKTRPTSSPRRVNTVFRLVRRSSTGEWNHHWEQLYPLSSSCCSKSESGSPREASASSDSDTTGILFTPRQGHAACCTNTSLSSVYHSAASVFIFGGRMSPTKALDDLFIYHYSHINANSILQHQSQSYCSFQLLNNAVKGSPPKPRWGHTFTSLANAIDNICNNNYSSERHLAVLVGGRDHSNAFSDVFVLSELPAQSSNAGYCGDKDVVDSCQLQWSKLADLEIPRFHHTTALISYPMLYDEVGETNNTDACINDTRILAVCGGLSNTTNLLDCFNMQQKRRTMELVSLSSNSKNHTTEGSKSQQPVLDDNFFLTSVVGAAACSWGNFVLLSGGVSCCGDDATGNPFSLLSLNHDDENSGNSGNVSTHRLFSYTPEEDKSDNFVLNVGSMVHHCAISLNRNRSIKTSPKEPDESKAATSIDKEFVLLGGGIPMFAFGPSYGSCYHASLQEISPIGNRRVGQTMETSNHEGSNNVVRFERKVSSSLPANDIHPKLPPYALFTSTSSNEEFKSTPTAVRTTVAFVISIKAKQLKTALEAASFLDKRYRMTKATKSSQEFLLLPSEASQYGIVAVPILNECVSAVNDPVRREELSWMHLVAGFGTHEVPYSSSILGRQK